MGLLVNGAKTVKHGSVLDAERFTIPIFKCFVDFCRIFYVVKMYFLCLQKTFSVKFGLKSFFRIVWYCESM